MTRRADPAADRAPASDADADADVTGLMQIGEVAARTELSLRSLRHWEDVGLLQPSHRTEGGFRLYTESDVEKILTIRRMKPLGFNLDQMRDVLTDLATVAATDASDSARAAARERLADITRDALERRERLHRQVEMADEFLALMSAYRPASP